jgi:hypothetical protein
VREQSAETALGVEEAVDEACCRAIAQTLEHSLRALNSERTCRERPPPDL